MNRYALATLALAAGAVAFSTSAAQAQLAHRYSFDTDGSDSVGTADGTLLANGTITGGQLVTTGTAAMTTGLSLPAGAVAGINGSFSIQQFYTSTALQANFAVGSSFSDGTTTNFLIFQPRRGDEGNPSSFAATGPNIMQHNFLGATADAAGVTYDVVFTYDAGSGNGNYYINGVLATDANGVASTFAIPGFDLSTKNAQIGINGNGPFPDPGLNGSTDDFRIFTNALSADQVATLDGLGAGASNAAVNAVVPEPATLGLLGVAGLGLLRRRRA